MDWNLNANMKMFARFTISHENTTENVNEFAGDPPSNPFLDRTYAFVDRSHLDDRREQDELASSSAKLFRNY